MRSWRGSWPGARRARAGPTCSTSARSRRTRRRTTWSRCSTSSGVSTTPRPGCISWGRPSASPTSPRSVPSSAELGLDDAVTLPGSVSGAELEAYFRAADVFVMASDHEGFCVPLAEAMGHGVPIVAYGVTAVPETVGDAGLVLDDKSPVPFAAAVGRVLADPGPAPRAGRDRACACGGVRPGRLDEALRLAGPTGRRLGAPGGGARSAARPSVRRPPRPPGSRPPHGRRPWGGRGRRCAAPPPSPGPGGARRRRAPVPRLRPGPTGRWCRPGGPRRRPPRAARRLRLATTASPRVMASSTGTPKPSCWEVTTSTSARAIRSASSSSRSAPVKTTAPRRPSSSAKRDSADV